MRVVEVHWADERDDAWHFARRVRDGQADADAMSQTRDEYARHPMFRFGELITPTFRVREIQETAKTEPPSPKPVGWPVTRS